MPAILVDQDLLRQIVSDMQDMIYLPDCRQSRRTRIETFYALTEGTIAAHVSGEGVTVCPRCQVRLSICPECNETPADAMVDEGSEDEDIWSDDDEGEDSEPCTCGCSDY